MALQEYIDRLQESRGLLFQRNLEALRNYINTTPEDTIIDEIYRIQTIDNIRTLWAAGLKTDLQHHSLNRYEQLTKMAT